MGTRFPACAKPWYRLVLSCGASAGEDRSEEIMLKQIAKSEKITELKAFSLLVAVHISLP
jgi:hypothetical protein